MILKEGSIVKIHRKGEREYAGKKAFIASILHLPSSKFNPVGKFSVWLFNFKGHNCNLTLSTSNFDLTNESISRDGLLEYMKKIPKTDNYYFELENLLDKFNDR